jgi:hypothetical protein
MGKFDTRRAGDLHMESRVVPRVISGFCPSNVPLTIGLAYCMHYFALWFRWTRVFNCCPWANWLRY